MKQTILTFSCILLLVAGCSDNNNNTPPIEDKNILADLASVSVDSDASSIDDRDELMTDIRTLFGDPDTDPVEVFAGDSLQDVIDRAGT